jgi:oxygen-independent coproporphyrinogen-3 oxidase
MISLLLKKYDIPVPRYTSYPTVPFWNTESFSVEKWKKAVADAFAQNAENGISLYLHIPFCEKLCTYCACNKRITVNHSVEMPYIEALLKEWSLYLELFSSAPLIREIHFGGGTPTFLSAENFDYLLARLFSKAKIAFDADFSFEAHPNYTNEAQLQTLFRYGFRRLSVGIQDFDERVQRAINRPQSFEQTKAVFDAARKIGYTSVNADMVYGLPFQNAKGLQETLSKVNSLRPDRIAFYGYAHVPWKSKSQRHFTEADLPLAEEKRNLYEIGRENFIREGYQAIGIDHFALPAEKLAVAANEGKMHRNFMGYTTQNTNLLIGLGASSISDTWTAFAQNVKEVEDYQNALSQGNFPLEKGHLLTEEDLYVRKHILALMCKGETSWSENDEFARIFERATPKLAEMQADGVAEVSKNSIRAKAAGMLFLRNIASALDTYLFRDTQEKQVFSRGV